MCCGAGVNSEQVAGARAYDEGKIAVLAGLAAGAGMALSQGLAVLASGQALIWGVALPMSLAGVATHYLTWLRARWAAFWQQSEETRSFPCPFIPRLRSPLVELFIICLI